MPDTTRRITKHCLLLLSDYINERFIYPNWVGTFMTRPEIDPQDLENRLLKTISQYADDLVLRGVDFLLDVATVVFAIEKLLGSRDEGYTEMLKQKFPLRFGAKVFDYDLYGHHMIKNNELMRAVIFADDLAAKLEADARDFVMDSKGKESDVSEALKKMHAYSVIQIYEVYDDPNKSTRLVGPFSAWKLDGSHATRRERLYYTGKRYEAQISELEGDIDRQIRSYFANELRIDPASAPAKKAIKKTLYDLLLQRECTEVDSMPRPETDGEAEIIGGSIIGISRELGEHVMRYLNNRLDDKHPESGPAFGSKADFAVLKLYAKYQDQEYEAYRSLPRLQEQISQAIKDGEIKEQKNWTAGQVLF